MASDVVSMTRMFRACYEVLKDELRLFHYVDLTEKGLERLGISKEDVNWHRQIEDVREKMLLGGRYGAFYTGAPLCLGGLRWWFKNNQRRLLNPTEGVIIPGNAMSGVEGATEALMRSPYMLIKTCAPLEKVMRGRGRGLVLQRHVTDWFQEKWSDFYLPPDNEGQWSQRCFHDFKLRINSKIFKVDISGPRSNGQFGNPGQGKCSTDFHLLCEVIGRDILWKSVVAGSDYGSVVFPEGKIWPERMVIWLNCLQDGLDYERIRDEVNT